VTIQKQQLNESRTIAEIGLLQNDILTKPSRNFKKCYTVSSFKLSSKQATQQVVLPNKIKLVGE
jgi:hypothetical protein